MSTKVITNFPLKARQFKSYAKKLSTSGDDGIFKNGMFMALEMIGIAAVADHMKQTSIDNFTQALTGNKLRIRTGRLSRSIMGVMSFSTSKYPAKMKKFITSNIPTSQEGFEGGKKESIRRVIVGSGKLEGIIGSTVDYAAIHEFGGKAGRGLSTTIPARPYLTPAVKETMPDIFVMFDELIHETFRQEHI